MSAVAVISASFSKHEFLRKMLLDRYPDSIFNKDPLIDREGILHLASLSEKIIVGRERIDQKTLSALSSLKLISKYGIGLDNLDLKAMQTQGVKLGWSPGVNKRSVAEMTLCMMIALFRNLVVDHSLLQKGQWQKSRVQQLSQKSIGIIGCGQIGQELIRLLKPFGCELLVYDPRVYENFYTEYGVKPVEFEEVLKEADLVSIHAPLNESTRGMVGKEQLALMKKGSFLINNARGGIVIEEDLATALRSGCLAGAACDVFEEEPLQGSPLTKLENFIATPHTGGSSVEAIRAMGEAAIQNIEHAKNVDEYAEYF